MKNSLDNKAFELVRNGHSAMILVEPEEYEGVLRIAKKSAEDIRLVTGVLPQIVSELPKQCMNVVLFATVGKSKLLEQLDRENKLSLNEIKGRREVYGVRIIDQPFEEVEKMLVIYGSEKRGTIYGIFSLSEKIGVSPLIFWGDAKPTQQQELILDSEIEGISREPSVEYRGFFINDEWPCFGNWTFNHYGGFTAKMYDKVFELLLRMKGNYLWPAMWTSSFALDGPDDENARLADIYGVIMGNSHHEPCLRASEEWDIYRGENSKYGNEWNYAINKNGLLKYWEDGLKRSLPYESIVTVGMRGERDSIMQGINSLQDSIDLLKDIIQNQKRLIEKHGDREVPCILSIYKEVEEYFYGDENTPGLKDWDGLDSIILMLCEDNYGNMRTLPDRKMQKHSAGYGMYYHLDYHGGPVSYEWVNSTPLAKIWEQMTECYEYGVQKVWMVNVGDLKGNEFPLSYFMALAYDFDKWGTNVPDSPQKYTVHWIKEQFGNRITEKELEAIQQLLTEGIWVNSLRRPEALNSHVYHPAHYHEADRMLNLADKLTEMLEELRLTLPKDCQDAYYSMIYYSLKASMNLLQMHLYAGKNEHYAGQGKKIANRYADMVTYAIKQDRLLAEEFKAIFDGKWNGMELGKHIGFRKWNEDGCRYPLRIQVEPFDRPRMVVSPSDRSQVCVKNYGNREQIEVRNFLYPGEEKVEIEVANDGIGSICCKVTSQDCPWLSINWNSKEIEDQEILRLTCIPDKLPMEQEKQVLLISDGDTEVELVIYGKMPHTTGVPPMTFYERDGVTSIYANHFAQLFSGETGQWKLLQNYGKSGWGLKAFPVTTDFPPGKGPAVLFRIMMEQAGTYMLEVWSAPSNPLMPKGRLCFGISLNGGNLIIEPSVSESFYGGNPENEEWSKGVLDQVHINSLEIQLQKGVNEISIYAVDAGFILEKLLVYRKGTTPLSSYLGPQESWYTKKE